MKITDERKEARETRAAHETSETREPSATNAEGEPYETKEASFGKERTVYKIAACGIFSALALIAFVIESLFPPLFIPSARMGISNIFVLLAAIALGVPYGAAVLIIKCVLGSVFSGNISAMIYSLPAGIIAFAAEVLAIRFLKKTSVTAASALGAVINSVCQNAVFCIVTNDFGFFVYLPYLSAIGAASGILVGLATVLILRIIPKKYMSGGLYEIIYDTNSRYK